MLQYEKKPITDWTKRNLRTVSTHLTVQEADELKNLCVRMGTKPYRLVRDYLLELIQTDRISRYAGPTGRDRQANPPWTAETGHDKQENPP